MKRNYIILLAALLTVACAGNGDTMSPTPQEGEILFSGSTVGPKVRTSYEDTARTWEPISPTRRLCRERRAILQLLPGSM